MKKVTVFKHYLKLKTEAEVFRLVKLSVFSVYIGTHIIDNYRTTYPYVYAVRPSDPTGVLEAKLAAAPRSYIMHGKFNQLENPLAKLTNGLFRGVNEDFLMERFERLDDEIPAETMVLPYADAIKIFYHYYMAFETFAHKYLDRDFWDTIVKYKVNLDYFTVNRNYDFTPEIYESIKKDGFMESYISKQDYEQIPDPKPSYELSKHGSVIISIPLDYLKVTEVVTERDWYDKFKAALPTLEDEYKRLVKEGEIDESDVEIYEE